MSIRWSVIIPKRAGSYTSMLLSEHLFKLYWDESPDNIAIQNPAAVVAGLRELRIGRLCRVMGKLPLQITFPSICKKSKLNYMYRNPISSGIICK